MNEQSGRPDELLRRAPELRDLLKTLEKTVRERGGASLEAIQAGRAVQTFCHEFGMNIIILLNGEVFKFILYPRSKQSAKTDIFTETDFQKFLKDHSISF